MELPEGMQYRVHHIRVPKEPRPGYLSDEYEPKGGKTVVEVGFAHYEEGKFTHFDPIARGEATCHYRDHYNRKRGRDIALGRALKDLREGQHSKKVVLQ